MKVTYITRISLLHIYRILYYLLDVEMEHVSCGTQELDLHQLC